MSKFRWRAILLQYLKTMPKIALQKIAITDKEEVYLPEFYCENNQTNINNVHHATEFKTMDSARKMADELNRKYDTNLWRAVTILVI